VVILGYHAQRDHQRYVHPVIARTGILPAGKNQTQSQMPKNTLLQAKSTIEIPNEGAR